MSLRNSNLVHLLKLGNKQLGELLVDDDVAHNVRALAIELLTDDNDAKRRDLVFRDTGAAIAVRLVKLDGRKLVKAKWSREAA